VDFNATNTSQFLTGISGLGLTTSSLSSLLVTTDIDGGSGKDNIQGIANNAAITNIIQGGAGADVLQGGIGADHFVYTSVNDSPASGQLTPGGQLAQTWDTITNFSHAQGDKIDLSAFGGLAWNGNAGPAAHAVWYGSDRNGGLYLFADTDGTGQADLKIDLQNVTSLVTSDIIGINLGEPTIQSVNDDFAPILGNVASGGVTNDTTPTLHISFSGTLAVAGDTVQLFDGSNALGGPITLTGANVTNGIDITLAALSDGAVHFKVVLSDGVNTGTSAEYIVTIDTTADVGADLTLTITDTTINASEAGTAGFSVSGLDGDLTSATVTFSDGVNPDVVVDVSGGDGSYSADLSSLTDGTITSVLNVTDDAGNTAFANGAAIDLDTTADVGA